MKPKPCSENRETAFFITGMGVQCMISKNMIQLVFLTQQNYFLSTRDLFLKGCVF